MIKACIFDLDGTLVDSEILWVESTKRFLAEQGHEVTPDEAEAIIYGVAWAQVCENLNERFPALRLTEEAMYHGLQPHFIHLRDTRDICIPSSIALLKQLSQTLPVCIVSGSYRVDVTAAIERAGIGDYLTFFLSDEDYHPGKPDSAGYLKAAERLGIAPASILVFEDSAIGVHGAKSAGMMCVALARPGRPRQDVSLADWVVEDLSAFSMDALLAKLDTHAASC